MPRPFTGARRRVRPVTALALLLALTLLASACGGDDPAGEAEPGTDPAPTTGATEDAGPTESAAGDFPVTIEHAFGETTIEAAPERVVTWGWGTADAAVALGVVPVAIPHQAYGGDEQGRLPWVVEAVEAAGAEFPEVLPNSEEVPFEAIAAADPDVILAQYSGITAEDHELLSAIAPTVAYPGEAWSTPWRDVVASTGQALGLDAEAEVLLADIEATIADAAESHPELAGLTVANVVDADGTFYVYRSADPRVEFLTDLGMEVAPSVDELDTEESTFFYTLSYEQIGEIESDVLVVYAETPEDTTAFLTDGPTAQMAQVQDGRVAVIEGAPLVAAVSPPTALSLTWGLDDYLAALGEAAAAVG